MDHAIDQLRNYMQATIEMYEDLPKEHIKSEIQAYVNALNELERFYYGEARTKIEWYL